MFLRHYALLEDPFGVAPNPRFLYFGREHREAMASLYQGILNGRGFTLMVAPPGMGKTTLLHYLCARIRKWATTAFLFSPSDDKNELLLAVMSELAIEPQSGAYHQNLLQFKRYLCERLAAGQKVVLIFDEAQSFSNETLENIRVLSNLETPESKLVQIILAGQPALLRKLSAPDLEQLWQRISVFGRILPLEEGEIEPYIRHRMQVAGRATPLFTPDAVASIARHSRGVPRNINSLCYDSMNLGWVLERQEIEAALVEQAARDIELPKAEMAGTGFCIDAAHGGNGAARKNGRREIRAATHPELVAELHGLLQNLARRRQQLEELRKATAACAEPVERGWGAPVI